MHEPFIVHVFVADVHLGRGLLQNEPQNSNPTYPTCTIAPDVEAQIGSALRSLLNNNGLSNVKIIGYEVDPALFCFHSFDSDYFTNRDELSA